MGGFAQFNGLQINLEKSCHVIEQNKRISVFCDFDGQHYYIGNKVSPRIDYSNPETWFKQDADTLRELSKNEFDRIAELVLGLSSINLLFGLNLNELGIAHDPDVVLLELFINGQSISYRLYLPLNPNNSHLKQFEDVCEQIILLAEENPDVFLERRTNKWYQRLNEGMK